MKVFTIIKQNLGLLFAPALLVLASCSSYQYSGYEADGIYGESRPGIWEQREQPEKQEVRPNNNTTYYKNLFAQQSEMYGEILEGDIFTDVDSYSSTPHYDNYMQDDQDGDGVAYSGGYAPWGNDPDTYTINFYNNGFYNPWYYGYGYGYGYYGYGLPYYRPGWFGPGYYPQYWNGYYAPIAYGYGPYWDFGFGISFGYPYYGYYHYTNPYWVYGYNPYNRYDRIAYNATRRSEPVRYSEGVSRRNPISDARASSYSRSIREIRNSRTSTYGTSRSRSSNNNDEVNVYTRTNRRVESRPIYESRNSGSDSRTYQSRSRTSNNTYRSSSSRRSSSMPARTIRSSSSTRSSATPRSSSSGGSRSSRGGRGGR